MGGTLNDNSPVTAAPVAGPNPVAPTATPVPRNKKKNLTALRYPVDIANDQDVLKFPFRKSGEKLEELKEKETLSLQGKIYLPIPGGLSDSISVSYKESTLNALQLAGAKR